MANIPLKTLKFPGLDDTYTVPQIDNTLSASGKAADAKKTGDEISALKDDLNPPSNIAPAYDATLTYPVGAFSSNENKIYQADTAINSPEAFHSGHWAQISLSDAVESVKGDFRAQIESGYLGDIPNLFKFMRSASSTVNGATYKSFPDGSVSVNGTASGDSHRYIGAIGDITTSAKTVSLTAGVTYRLWFDKVSGSVTGSTDVNMLKIVSKSSTSTVLSSVKISQEGQAVTYTPSSNVNAYLCVCAIKNNVYSNLKIVPHFSIDTSSKSNTGLDSRVSTLENLVSDVVITPSMFEEIAVIGDSFASGVSSETGTAFTYSWLQMMAREYGCTGMNFAEGGLTTRTWLTSDYGLSLLQSSDPCDLYFIALGINDSNPDSRNVPVGTAADMTTDPHPDTFYGNMATIRDAILAKNEHAVICLITPMRIGDRYTPYQDAVLAMATAWGCLVVDWRDVPYCNSTWWTSHLSNLHPTVPMYGAMMHSIVALMSNAIRDNLTYMGAYPNVVNS